MIPNLLILRFYLLTQPSLSGRWWIQQVWKDQILYFNDLINLLIVIFVQPDEHFVKVFLEYRFNLFSGYIQDQLLVFLKQPMCEHFPDLMLP